MKLLIITPYLPYPQDEGGKIRIYNLMRVLHLCGASIDFLSLIYDESELKNVEAVKKICSSVNVALHKPPPRNRSFISRLNRALTSPPDLMTKRFNSELMKITDDILKKNKYDVILIEQLYAAQYITGRGYKNVVLSEHNVESEIFSRYAHTKNISSDIQISRWGLRNNIEVLKLKHHEKKVWREINNILVVSERDRKYINNAVGGLNLDIIPNGVDLSDFNSSFKIDNSFERDIFGGYENDFKLVFTGSFTHFPNTDAVLYFYHNIFLRLKHLIPNIRFFVVGKNPYPDLIKLSSDDRVIVTNYVDDVRPYICKSDAFIVPLRIGGGSRLKILQAMGMSKCIVSTSIGAEGIDCENNKNILLADSDNDFINTLIDLSKNRDKADKIGKAAADLALEKYDWKSIGRKLFDYLENIKNNVFNN